MGTDQVGTIKVGQVKSRQVKCGHVKLGLVRSWQVKSKLGEVGTGWVWTGQVCTKSFQTIQNRSSPEMSGPARINFLRVCFCNIWVQFRNFSYALNLANLELECGPTQSNLLWIYNVMKILSVSVQLFTLEVTLNQIIIHLRSIYWCTVTVPWVHISRKVHIIDLFTPCNLVTTYFTRVAKRQHPK